MYNVEHITDKMLGCLYGQAIGDALGLGTEFMTQKEIAKHYPTGLQRYDQIIQDAHRRRWPTGAWTDDTDMMLCILNGYETDKFNNHKIAQNFKQWFNTKPMGIGSHTHKVLLMGDYVKQPENCSRLWWELSQKQSAANGALMRTSVVGLAPDNIEQQAEQICKLTHFDPRCIGSCVITSLIIHNLIYNDTTLSYRQIQTISSRYDDRIAQWIDKAYNSPHISDLNLDDQRTMGYTLRTLAAALWCYFHAPSFDEGLLIVVNQGGDADTNAAVACAILGAKYGYKTIPQNYIQQLHNQPHYHQQITTFIQHLLPK